jgi:hypothetical protein
MDHFPADVKLQRPRYKGFQRVEMFRFEDWHERLKVKSKRGQVLFFAFFNGSDE